MSIATEVGVARARRAFTRDPRRLADEAPICLVCGKPASAGA